MFFYISVCLLSLLAYYAYRVVSWCLRIVVIATRVEKLPGDDRYWLYGNLKNHPGATEAGLMHHVDYMNRHGNRVYKFWFGPFRPTVRLCHPDTIKLIVRTTEPKVLSSGGYRHLIPWLGDGLVTSSGKKWQRNRKLLTPAFHFGVLKSYLQAYNDAAEIMLEKWTNSLSSAPGQSIEVFNVVSLCTLDIILRCAFSYSSDVQNEGSPYMRSVLSLEEMITERSLIFPWYIDWIYYRSQHGKRFARNCDYVHDVADKLIRERRQVLKEKPKDTKSKYLDFLDILLTARDENGCGLTDIEIRNEVDTVLFAGHDTTASTISWCLYHLAKHPAYQQKARDEVDAVLDGRDTPSVLWDDLGEFPYLTMCIKESIRRVPPVFAVSRELDNPLTVEGVDLLPGTIVSISIFDMHHNPSVWGDDHMDYKPERFSHEAMKSMDSHAFLPFSAGPRNCIGQTFAMHEVKVVMARILHRFSFELDVSHNVEMLPRVIMKAKDGIKLIFTAKN